MLYFTKKKSQCTGCSACTSICPKQCIKMEKDEEGFLYPLALNGCIHCGKCERVCPRLNEFSGHELGVQSAFVGTTRKKKIWRRSASGGAFSLRFAMHLETLTH